MEPSGIRSKRPVASRLRSIGFSLWHLNPTFIGMERSKKLDTVVYPAADLDDLVT